MATASAHACSSIPVPAEAWLAPLPRTAPISPPLMPSAMPTPHVARRTLYAIFSEAVGLDGAKAAEVLVGVAEAVAKAAESSEEEGLGGG